MGKLLRAHIRIKNTGYAAAYPDFFNYGNYRFTFEMTWRSASAL